MENFVIIWIIASVITFVLYIFDYRQRSSVSVGEVLIHILLTLLPTSIVVVVIVAIVYFWEYILGSFSRIGDILGYEIKLKGK
jgi:hypothetical protein